MRVGLIADTHDRIPAVAELVRCMQARGVGMVLHAGDHCSPFSLGPFRDAAMPLAGIFGRNDGDPEGLKAAATLGMGMELYQSPHSLEVSGQRILLVHDLADAAERSVASHSVVVHGLQHRPEVASRAGTLVVNPGEGCGWLTGVPSAAVLDLESLTVDFVRLDATGWSR